MGLIRVINGSHSDEAHITALAAGLGLMGIAVEVRQIDLFIFENILFLPANLSFKLFVLSSHLIARC